MKLGKGPTSLLDRHSAFNDTTALRLRSDILGFLENLYLVTRIFVATNFDGATRAADQIDARIRRDADQICRFHTTRSRALDLSKPESYT